MSLKPPTASLHPKGTSSGTLALSLRARNLSIFPIFTAFRASATVPDVALPPPSLESSHLSILILLIARPDLFRGSLRNKPQSNFILLATFRVPVMTCSKVLLICRLAKLGHSNMNEEYNGKEQQLVKARKRIIA